MEPSSSFPSPSYSEEGDETNLSAAAGLPDSDSDSDSSKSKADDDKALPASLVSAHRIKGTDQIGSGGVRPHILAALGERIHMATSSSRPQSPSTLEIQQADSNAIAARETWVLERTQASPNQIPLGAYDAVATLTNPSVFESTPHSSRPRSPPSCPRQPLVSHIFICYGSLESWPSTGPMVSQNSLPGSLSVALRARELTRKITLALFDPGNSDFREGDVLLFPVRKCYRSLDATEVDDFVDMIMSGDSWFGEPKVLMGSYFFLCCHDHGDALRECSVCGPAMLMSLIKEIQVQSLQDRVECFGCTCVAETTGEMVLFKATEADEHESVYYYSHLFPGCLRLLLSDIFGDGTLSMATTRQFYELWTVLLQFLNTGASVRACIVTIPLRLNASFMTLKIAREELLKNHVERLVDLSLLLRAAAATCKPEEMTFHWLEVTQRELQLVVRSIYCSARNFRKRVTADATGIPPTAIQLYAVPHIERLVWYGELISEFVMVELGGDKPFPRGKYLLKPIHGLKIREEED